MKIKEQILCITIKCLEEKFTYYMEVGLSSVNKYNEQIVFILSAILNYLHHYISREMTLKNTSHFFII